MIEGKQIVKEKIEEVQNILEEKRELQNKILNLEARIAQDQTRFTSLLEERNCNGSSQKQL
mgnify:CR=1 FL=1